MLTRYAGGDEVMVAAHPLRLGVMTYSKDLPVETFSPQDYDFRLSRLNVYIALLLASYDMSIYLNNIDVSF